MTANEDWLHEPVVDPHSTILHTALVADLMSRTVSAYGNIGTYLIQAGTDADNMKAAREIITSVMHEQQEKAEEQNEGGFAVGQIRTTYALGCAAQILADAYLLASEFMLERVDAEELEDL